jgi:monothiol glutaredoxin
LLKIWKVLADWDVREGIKQVNSWPTIPQLFVGGKFIGGCDITMEMHRSGELKKVLGVK